LVILAWTFTVAALVIPPAVTVMVALPLTGFLFPSRPLQLIGVVRESQTPAQIRPALETVTMLLFEEEYVMFAATAPLEEFSGVAEIWTTSPEFSEKEVGESTREETVLLTLLEPPPQPTRIMEINKSNTVTMADLYIHPPRRAPTLADPLDQSQ
jgi:hypothetical protein